MPRLAFQELKSFVTNYLYPAKSKDLIEASYFFLDCVMNAFMRIIMYIKTKNVNESSWDYLDHAILNFLSIVQVCILLVLFCIKT